MEQASQPLSEAYLIVGFSEYIYDYNTHKLCKFNLADAQPVWSNTYCLV